MKIKALVVLLAILVGITFVAIASAQQMGQSPQMTTEFQKKWVTAKSMHFDGTVVSHDVSCHCFVTKGASGKALILQDDYAKMDQEYDKANGLKVGQKASGDYKTIDMIQYATEVHQE